jgi:hypothetical protein
MIGLTGLGTTGLAGSGAVGFIGSGAVGFTGSGTIGFAFAKGASSTFNRNFPASVANASACSVRILLASALTSLESRFPIARLLTSPICAVMFPSDVVCPSAAVFRASVLL